MEFFYLLFTIISIPYILNTPLVVSGGLGPRFFQPMHLRTYLTQLPKTERTAMRKLLAQRADVTPTTVHNWEMRRHRPTPEHFNAIRSWSRKQVTWRAMYGNHATHPVG